MASNKEKVTGETAAAIALAMHQLNEEVHDIENAVLTFGKAGRVYSPWSSKIYGLNQLPPRR
jgi:hypothetical protein